MIYNYFICTLILIFSFVIYYISIPLEAVFIVITLGILLFYKYVKQYVVLSLLIIVIPIYINNITYNGDLKGIKMFYVKIDGKNGNVIKINNKYNKKQIYVDNTKKLEYGYYVIKGKVVNVKEKENYVNIKIDVLGYKEGLLNKSRKYILNIFDNLFIGEDNLYAFAKASIAGDKSDLSKDVNDKFKYTGLAHLIVISGSHISMVIMWTVNILDKFLISYKKKYFVALIILTYYCTIVGLSPAILRAYLMGIFMILARLYFEEEDSKKSFFVSFIIIFILNPYSLIDISFQLSYIAVGTMIFIYPIFEQLYERKVRIKNKLLDDMIKIVILSFCIQLYSTPIFIIYFKKMSLFSFLINIVGIPVGTILIEMLFFLTLLNFIRIEMLNLILFNLINYTYLAFEGFVFVGNKIPLLQIELKREIDVISIVLYCVFILYITYIVDTKNREYFRNKKSIKKILK